MENQSVMERVFEGYSVRAFIDEDGNPWFVAKDVCDILGITNSRDAVAGLDDDERGVGTTDTTPSGGGKDATTVSESGLYSLIFKGRKQEAINFRKWITNTIIPEIRKTGGFGLTEAKARIEYLESELARLYQIVEANMIPLDSPVRKTALRMAESVAKTVGKLDDEDFIIRRFLLNCRLMGAPAQGTLHLPVEPKKQLSGRHKQRRLKK